MGSTRNAALGHQKVTTRLNGRDFYSDENNNNCRSPWRKVKFRRFPEIAIKLGRRCPRVEWLVTLRTQLMCDGRYTKKRKQRRANNALRRALPVFSLVGTSAVRRRIILYISGARMQSLAFEWLSSPDALSVSVR